MRTATLYRIGLPTQIVITGSHPGGHVSGLRPRWKRQAMTQTDLSRKRGEMLLEMDVQHLVVRLLVAAQR